MRGFSYVGQPVVRVDAWEKVTGKARYVADLRVEGVWEAVVVTAPVPHGLLRSIKTPQAAQGLVLTAADIPGENQVGVVAADQPLLATDRVRWAGERVALVAAPSRGEAEALARAVVVEVDPLPVVETVEQALEPGAVAIHPQGNVLAELCMVRGDVEGVMARADVIVEHTYRTGYQEHAYLEPQGALVVPEEHGVVVYSSTQCPFYVRKAVARVLGLALSRVRVVQTCTGGGFGGKEDYPSEVAACAALLAYHAGRPVRLIYSREEDFRWSSKRHRTVIHHRLAADSSGRMLAMQIEALYDAGAYAGLSVVVAERATTSACGPYSLEAVEVRTKVVYTNNLFTGAFRGFGAPQVTFATERQVDELARRLGMDPVRVRAMNLWRRGSTTPWGEVLGGRVPARLTLRRALRLSGYARVRPTHSGPVRRGTGVSTTVYGNNLHQRGQRLDQSHARITIHADGSVSVWVGLTEMGQGLLTSVAVIAAEALGAPLERIKVNLVDTDAVADSGPTVASRGTVMSGEAVRRAALALRARLLRVARARFGLRALSLRRGWVYDSEGNPLWGWDDLVGACAAERIPLSASGFHRTRPRPYDPATGQGQPYAVYSYAAHVAEVEVDVETGAVRVIRVSAVHDVGRTVFPEGIKGQVEGGVVQGMGMALFEELHTHGGELRTLGFSDYAIPQVADVPAIAYETVEFPWRGGPYGAKGIGEPSLIGVPAALANAVSNALGLPVTDLPLTPERVWRMCRSLSP